MAWRLTAWLTARSRMAWPPAVSAGRGRSWQPQCPVEVTSVARWRDDRKCQCVIADQPLRQCLDRVGRHLGEGGERLVERQDAIVECLLASKPRSHVPALLEPELEAAARVGACLLQLGLGDRFVADACELGEDGFDGLGQVVWIDAGID